jgi:hypothetical protein
MVVVSNVIGPTKATLVVFVLLGRKFMPVAGARVSAFRCRK